MPAISTIKKKRRKLMKKLIAEGHSEAHARNLAQGEMNKRYGHGWQSYGANAGYWIQCQPITPSH